jgi:hypothetical protein
MVNSDQENKMSIQNKIVAEALYLPTVGVYQLIDKQGRVAMVRKDLIDDNKLEIIDGVIPLTSGQYEAWFKIQERIKRDEALFRPNVYKFFESREYLVAHPELGNKYSTQFGAFSYCSVSPSLGALALSFLQGERTTECQYCQQNAHLFRSIGSVLSGISSQDYICENAACQRVNTIRKGGMGETVKYFVGLNETYTKLYPAAKSYESFAFADILSALPV